MEQLRKTNAFMEKWIYVIMPLIMLLGLTSGQGLSAWTGWTSFLFMILTFISSMQADYRKFVLLFKKTGFPRFVHGRRASGYPMDRFSDQRPSLPFPSGFGYRRYVVNAASPWRDLHILGRYNKASVETTLSLVSLDTLLSPFIVPLTLSVVLGSHVSLNVESLTMNLLKLVLIPTVLGMLFWRICDEKKRRSRGSSPLLRSLAKPVFISSSC